MDVVVVDCEQLVCKRNGVQGDLVVLDDEPGVAVVGGVAGVDGEEYLAELLTHLDNEGDAAVEGILLDLVNDGDGCKLAHVGRVVLALVVPHLGLPESLAVLPADPADLVVQMPHYFLVVALPSLGAVVEGGEVVGDHLSGFEGYPAGAEGLGVEVVGEVGRRGVPVELREPDEG